jgi:hypothetical protein
VVLEHAEDVGNVRCAKPSASVFEVLDLLGEIARSGTNLAAVLLTQDGTAASAVRGIVTVSDVPELLALAYPRPLNRSQVAELAALELST